MPAKLLGTDEFLRIVRAVRRHAKQPLVQSNLNPACERGPIDRVKEQPAARLQDARDFAAALPQVVHVLEDIHAHHSIDGRIGQRNCLGTPRFIGDREIAAGGVVAGGLECGQRRIDADDVRAQFRNGLGHEPATAAEIEYTLARPGTVDAAEPLHAGLDQGFQAADQISVGGPPAGPLPGVDGDVFGTAHLDVGCMIRSRHGCQRWYTMR